MRICLTKLRGARPLVREWPHPRFCGGPPWTRTTYLRGNQGGALWSESDGLRCAGMSSGTAHARGLELSHQGNPYVHVKPFGSRMGLPAGWPPPGAFVPDP